MSAKKCLLIAPASYDFKLDNSNTIERVPTDNKSISDILLILKDSLAEVLIVPVEQTIMDSAEVNFSGLELIKHIRLTPELGDTSKLPIICLHWHSVDYYINMNKENIFLYSPGIYNYQYPIENLSIGDLKPLAESLNPFLFGSEKDDNINDHVFRNEIAIKQFEKQLNNPAIVTLNEKLWFKKVYYKNFSLKKTDDTNVNLLEELKLKILLVDDLADKWEKPLRLLLPKSKLYIESDPVKLIPTLKGKYIIDKDDLNSVNKDVKSSVDSFCSKSLKSVYDIILLDIYFSNDEKEIESSSGYNFLKRMEESQIDIPVIIFSATLKELSEITSKFNFVLGRFIKGYTPLLDFSKKIEDVASISSLLNIATNVKKLEIILSETNVNFYKKKIDGSGKIMLCILTASEVFNIRLNLRSLLSKIHLITNSVYISNKKSEINKNLLEVIGLLGIIQEYRLDKDCPNRYLSDSEKNLIGLRNVAFHSNTNLFYNTQQVLNNWNRCNFNQRVQMIENALLKTYQCLLFGK